MTDARVRQAIEEYARKNPGMVQVQGKSPLERRHVDQATIRVIGKLIDLNRYARSRGARIRGIEASKELVREAWIRAGRPVVQSPFKVDLLMILSSRRLDPSNMSAGARKAFLDAATDVGMIENDTWACHVGPDSDSWEYSSKMSVYIFTVTHVGKAF